MFVKLVFYLFVVLSILYISEYGLTIKYEQSKYRYKISEITDTILYIFFLLLDSVIVLILAYAGTLFVLLPFLVKIV